MFSKLFTTRAEWSPTIARLSLGLLLFPHGGQHFAGWFGGYGFHGTLGWMTGTLGFPASAAAVAIVIEFVAPFLLIAGLGSRVAALGLIGLMIGAITTHWPNGFFMNWFSAMPAGTEGYEYHLVVIALAVTVVINGSGKWSVDRRIAPATGGV
jgi:putative oxidoreductase